MERAPHGAAREEIHPRAAEFASTRSREREAQPPRLDLLVHDVQQRRRRCTSSTTTHELRGQRVELGREQRRIDEIPLVASLVEQIDPMGVGVEVAKPGALAAAARPKRNTSRAAARRDVKPGLARQQIRRNMPTTQAARSKPLRGKCEHRVVASRASRQPRKEYAGRRSCDHVRASRVVGWSSLWAVGLSRGRVGRRS